MTVQELYDRIGGDYEQAIRVLRMDKLIDKHIRKLITSGVPEALIEAGKDGDPTRLFEAAHAVKGVCANLGLVRMSGVASDIAEEFRPGNSRRLTDEELAGKLDEFSALYQTAIDGISQYSK